MATLTTTVKPIENEKKKFFSSTIVSIVTNITVEPVVFFFFVGLLMSNVITQSLVIRKFCLLKLELPDETCRTLTSNATLESEAQTYAAKFIMYKTILDTLPSAVWGLFIGSWSDQFGRKALLIVPNFGAVISMVLLAVIAYYETELDENFIFISAAVTSLTGSTLVLNTGSISYIADITTTEQRTYRFAILAAALFCGAPVGLAVGGQIFEYLNYKYEPVFIISAGILLLNTLYVIFFLKESVNVKKHSNYCTEFFNIENVKDTFKTLTKKRENNGRQQLILLILAVSIIFMPVFAEHNLTYMYTRLKFEWDEVTFSHYVTIELIFACLGLMVCLPIMSNIFKIKDITIGILSCVSRVIMEVIIGVSIKGWMLFAITPVHLLVGLVGSIVKTIISKIVLDSEQGKISSVIAMSEGIVPTIGSFLLTPLYEATKDTDLPGAIYFVTAAVTVIPICFLLAIYIQNVKMEKQTPSATSVNNYTPTNMEVETSL